MEDLNYWTYLFCFLAGLSNGIMDILQFKYKNSFLDKIDGDGDSFDPLKSWKNKYKDFGSGKFWDFYEYLRKYSLVFTTDLWHLSQWFMITFFSLAIISYTPNQHIIMEFLFIRFVPFHLGFWVTYEFLNKK